MFDIDPQIIKIGKVFLGVMIGFITGASLPEFVGLTGFTWHVCFVALGIITGMGLGIIWVFKSKNKDENEE